MNIYAKLFTLIATVSPFLSFAQEDSIQPQPTHTFKPIGYLRASIGESEGGKTMAQFILPGAGATYRLGNEPDTFGEFGLSYTYNMANGQSLDIVGQLTGYAPFDSGQDFKLDNVGQFYVKMNNIVGDADIWVGKRFYNRSDYHILNYVWTNVGQEANLGLGIEDINVFNKKGKLAIALFNFENKNVHNLQPQQDQEAIESGNLKSYILEARLTDLNINANGSLNFWGRLANRRGNTAINYERTTGYGVGVWHQQSNLFKGNATNHLYASFRRGITVNQYQYSGLPVYEIYGNQEVMNYNMKKNYTIELAENFHYEIDKKFAVNFLAMYRVDNHGLQPFHISTGESLGDGENIKWMTTGFRLMKFFHKHFGLALEASNEYIDNQTITKHGWMQKVTFAPQISWNYGFYSRPVIRPFVTFAHWSESLKGTIGNGPGDAPFADKTNGLTYGVSFEVWF